MSRRDKILLRVGEAVAGAGVAAAEPEIAIGEMDGPLGYAFANLLGSQVYGHTRLLALLNVNWMARPPTIMVSKVTMKNTDYVNLFAGPVQWGTAKAVIDSVQEGTIPRENVNELAIIDSVWLNPKATVKNKEELFKNNYEGTKLAIKRAMAFEPSIEELIEKKETIRHVVHDRI